MPIYEYRCEACGREMTFLVLRGGAEKELACKGCGGSNLSRLLSRFAHHSTEGDRLGSLDARKPQDDSFYRDSRNIGLWAKKRAKELGADKVLGDKLDEIVERGRSGKILDDLGD